jgi:NAD(P)-dependent dehydrogenase (short-subunit alcohol dehydrogenase family)
MNNIELARHMNGMMDGRTCIITGGTSGIGKQTAIALARMDARVIITARTDDEGEAAREEIRLVSGSRLVDFIDCELSDFASVRDCCARFAQANGELHVLVNNAGTWRPHREVSKDGFEMTFAVNHLSHFLMTNLLLGMLRKSAPARVISVSSGLHHGTIDFEDIGFERRYRGMAAYRQSKLANILFVKELSRRLAGTGVTANCLMPGFVATGLFRDSSIVSKGFVKAFGSTPEKGAQTSVYLASSPEVKSVTGKCFRRRQVVSTSAESNDPDLAARLWALSEKLTQKWLPKDASV